MSTPTNQPPKITFGKLVRFKIPDLYKEEYGIELITRKIDPKDPEAAVLLTEKLKEEFAELSEALESGSQLQIDEEMGDLLEVNNSILLNQVTGVDHKVINSVFIATNGIPHNQHSMIEKRKRKGDFSILVIIIGVKEP